MKTLTNAEIVGILERMDCQDESLCNDCPLERECLHYLTGDCCGSCFEKDET